MWFRESEQLSIMPPAAPPATSLLSLFILTSPRPPSTSCCHTERSRTGKAARNPETNACPPHWCVTLSAQSSSGGKQEERFHAKNKKKVVNGLGRKINSLQSIFEEKRQKKGPFTHSTLVVRLPWTDYVQFGHNSRVCTAAFVEFEKL